MFIRRCGWHRRYHGHGKLLGITAWRNLTVTFSDGMCDACAVRAREEWGLPSIPLDDTDDRGHASRWTAFPFATVAFAASIALVIASLVRAEPRS